MDVNKILAVIVIYKNSLSKSKTFSTLNNSLFSINQRLDLLVYDNSPFEFKQESITGVESSFDIIYQRNYENVGVSSAYNYASELAIKRNKKWIFILDQDTYFPINTFETISNINIDKVSIFCPILKNNNNNKIISPSIFKFQRGFETPNINIGLNSLKKYSPLNSGLIIELDLFTSVGGYNIAAPIDYSDFAFFKRIKKQVSDFYVLPIICKHDLSSGEPQSLSNSIFRFKSLCNGSINSCENLKEIPFIYFNLISRCIKLTINFKNTAFIKILYNAIL